MLNEMTSQVTSLDLSKFKVMLVWDPDNARDVGWLTVEKDARVDLSVLQVRDVNLAKASCCKGAGTSNEPNQEVTFGVNNVEGVEMNGNNENNSGEAIASKVGVVDKAKLFEYRLKCKECGLSVLSSQMGFHMKRAHDKIFKYEKVSCDICGCTVDKVNLNIHKRLIHDSADSPSKPRPSHKVTMCNNCGKEFSSPKSLSSHKRWCTNDVQCSNCKKRFRSKESLDQHISSCKMIKEIPVEVSVKREKDTEEEGNNIGTSESNAKTKERVNFNIVFEDKAYGCSRSKGLTVKASLKKFCKHVIGKDLQFQFAGKILTGLEIVDTFSGGNILANSSD